jgi:hypothetical protein
VSVVMRSEKYRFKIFLACGAFGKMYAYAIKSVFAVVEGAER